MTQRRARRVSAAFWTVQGLLAALFLFAGGMKLALPAEALTAQSALPSAFLRFIGVCEVLGAAGLVLPGLFRIRTALTPVAASGLVVIMSGAVGFTLAGQDASLAWVPALVGIVAATVAYGRWAVVPLGWTATSAG
jgi:hypothetical protein